MARVRTQELTIEEKLNRAIVPDDEQLYRVPGNWVWTRLRHIVELISGRDVAISLCNNKERGIPYILGASNLESNGFSVERWIENPVVVSVAGDILLSVKGTIGKIYLQQEPEINISRQIMALRSLSNLDKLFLKFFLEHICDLLKEAGNGLIPGISREIILEKECPLPPLAEQLRIVDRIESLFAKLDQAKELAQNALETFETRKAAILHKAFNGEFTTKWREKHGVGMESWEERTIAQLCEAIVDCPHSTPQWTTDGKICLRTTNIKSGYLDLSEIRFVSEETFEQRTQKLKPRGGDILYTREGTVGDVAVIPDGFEICMGQRMMLLRPFDDVLPNFIVYYLRSPEVLELILQKTGGSTSQHINVKDVKQIIVPTPPLPEQKELVSILDSLFDKEQQAKELVNVIDKIDLMKKAILARAFRGELGTNDLTEESAAELLKEVLLNR